MSARYANRPQNSAVSVPGAIGRNKSAASAVAVRRGSMTTKRGAALVFRSDHPLVQDRMAPRRIGADQHDEVGLVEVAVDARHRIGAESAPVACDRRRHAKPRVGIDIGRAEKTFHQLVGDVIILGQQLAGQIKRNRVRPVAVEDRAQSVRDLAQRRVPIGYRQRAVGLTQHGMQQALFERQGLAQRRSF